MMNGPPGFRILPELQIFSVSGIHSLLRGPIWQRVGPTTWRGIAPGSYQSGAMNQVSIDPRDRNTIYASSFDGGLWRLDNVSDYPTRLWTPLTDRETTLRTCSFAIAPSDNRILYLADGLGRILRSSDRGNRWVPTNSRLLRYDGRRWRPVTGSNRFNYVSKILVHPTDPDTVYVASEETSHIWDFTGQPGFWKSDNRGNEWREILSGEASDAAMDPRSPSIIYVGIRGHGLFKTSNAQADRPRFGPPIFPFSRVTTIPPGADAYGRRMIKIALGRQGNDSNRLVAVKFHKQLFINRRGGRNRNRRRTSYAWEREAWESKGDRGQTPGIYDQDQSNYDNVIAVDPFNNNNLLSGLQDLYRCSVGASGAESWQIVAGSGTNVHSDHLCIEFDHTQNGVVYLANDGGVYRSGDGGLNWSELNRGLFTSQVWGDAAIANNVVVASFYHQGLSVSADARSDTSEWIVLTGPGHEFSRTIADPKRPNVFYVFQDPHLERHVYSHTPIPALNIVTIGNFKARAIAVDTRPDSNILLAGSIEPTAIRRTFEGDSNNPTWTDETVDNLTPNEQITSISFAPSNPSMAYAISNLGKVYRKDDVSSSGYRQDDASGYYGRWINRGRLKTTTAKQVVVNPRHSNRIYVLTNNTISLSDDGGASFNPNPIHGSGNRALPTDREFKSLVAHPLSSGTLYLATEVDVFVTFSEGRYWDRFDSGLPNVVIINLSLDGSLYAATMGRGLWKTRAPLFFFPGTLRS
jgi:hypothetical protein